MGCQLSKEESTIQDEDNGLNGSFKSVGAPLSKTNKNQQSIDKIKSYQEKEDQEKKKKPWNILAKISGTKKIKIQREVEKSNGTKREIVEMIKKNNSSPEFGFSRVFKTTVTEKPIIQGALMNIIVLSEGEGDQNLIVRVFSVKAGSIEYEFCNYLSCELDWEKLDEIHCCFDLDTSELLIYGPQSVLYKIKLDQNKTKSKEVKSEEIQPQAEFIKKIKQFAYHRFKDNKSKHPAVYCSKLSSLEDLCGQKTQQ